MLVAHMQTPRRSQSFQDDLRMSLGVWREEPLLPIVSAVLTQGPHVLLATTPLALPIAIWALGWSGTKRLWYQHLYSGKSLRPAELVTLTSKYVVRFIRLYILLAVIVAPFFLLAMALIAGTETTSGSLPLSTRGRVLVATTALTLQFLLTFVPPVLTFSTSSARVALREGFAFLRSKWPGSAPYAVLPPALTIPLYWENPIWDAMPLFVATSTAVGLLNLLFAGATVAFYLRHIEEAA